FAAGWLLVGPRANVPVIDDWVYAWSVEHLLDTGRLQVLEISAFYPITQILWGALFARLAGFSFVVLRSSTVVLALFGCWAGCVCAMAAFLTRPIGIVLPLALLPALVGSRDGRTMFRRSVTPLVITLIVMSALQVEMPRTLGLLDWAAIRQNYLRWWFAVPIA